MSNRKILTGYSRQFFSLVLTACLIQGCWLSHDYSVCNKEGDCAVDSSCGSQAEDCDLSEVEGGDDTAVEDMLPLEGEGDGEFFGSDVTGEDQPDLPCVPLLEERCDGIDNTCDGVVDEGCDSDGDGWCRLDDDLILEESSPLCPNGYGDCDDLGPYSSWIYPGATELCDGLDNDCSDGADTLWCAESAEVIAEPMSDLPSIPAVAVSPEGAVCYAWFAEGQIHVSDGETTYSRDYSRDSLAINSIELSHYGSGFILKWFSNLDTYPGNHFVHIEFINEECGFAEEAETIDLENTFVNGTGWITSSNLIIGSRYSAFAFTPIGLYFCYSAIEHLTTELPVEPEVICDLERDGDYLITAIHGAYLSPYYAFMVVWSDLTTEIHLIDEGDFSKVTIEIELNSGFEASHISSYNGNWIITGFSKDVSADTYQLWATSYNHFNGEVLGPYKTNINNSELDLGVISSLQIDEHILVYASQLLEGGSYQPFVASFSLSSLSWGGPVVDTCRVSGDLGGEPVGLYPDGNFAAYVYREIDGSIRVGQIGCSEPE